MLPLPTQVLYPGTFSVFLYLLPEYSIHMSCYLPFPDMESHFSKDPWLFFMENGISRL